MFKNTVTSSNFFLKLQFSLYFSEISPDIQSPTSFHEAIKRIFMLFLANKFFERLKIDICHFEYLPDHDNHNEEVCDFWKNDAHFF